MANYRALARTYAQREGLDPNVFERQINQESGFNPNSRSGAGAIGIAQFMPGTAKSVGVNPNNPRQSLKGAAKLMAQYVKKYGNYRDALAAYNGGPGVVGHSLPAETQQYIKIILGGHNPKAPRGGTATTRTVPGVDRSAERRSLVARYILDNNGLSDLTGGSNSADPLGIINDPIIQLAAGLKNAKDTPGSTMTVRGGGNHRGAQGGVISRRTLGRTDQGVDFTGSGPIPAADSGTITRVVPRGGGSGWPGGGFIVIKLDHPPDPHHRYAYVAENISPKVRVGQHVSRGQAIAHAHGSYPFLETGWAADANGTTLARATTGYSEGQQTQAGKSYKRYLGV